MVSGSRNSDTQGADLFAAWGTPVETERRRRVRLSIWAYAYEMRDVSLVDDHTFDRTARASDPAIITGRFDDWWCANFDPSTGLWIASHPGLTGIANLFARLT